MRTRVKRPRQHKSWGSTATGRINEVHDYKTETETLVAVERFSVNEDFHNTLQNTIEAPPNGTASGNDGIYYEMSKAAAKETVLCLSYIWEACGKTAHSPTE